MSQSAMQEITCPKCGKKHSFQVWDSINTLEFPEMKEKVRNDEAFRYRCPDCGATALLNYNFLYHQQEDKILIFGGAFPLKQCRKRFEQQKLKLKTAGIQRCGHLARPHKATPLVSTAWQDP